MLLTVNQGVTLTHAFSTSLREKLEPSCDLLKLRPLLPDTSLWVELFFHASAQLVRTGLQTLALWL
jgi:hypothetical protein